MKVLLTDKEIDRVLLTPKGARDGYGSVAKAQAKKIALELQIIHSIPDPKICDRKMKEFIKELLEEVGSDIEV